MTMHNVELRIRRDVYQQALAVAQSQGVSLASIARMVIYQAQAEVERQKRDANPPAVDDGQRVPLRKYGEERTVMRFTIPRDRYVVARQAIRQSGRSVSAAVEDGLANFVEKETL